jgi:hypothetical protein
MSLRSIYCTVTTRGRVDSMLVDLRDEGFSTAEISILFLDPDKSIEAVAPTPVAHASTGAIRGVIASIDGIHRLVIPGLGPIIVSGAIASGTAATGSGAISSMLNGFGVPGAEATRYATRIMAGEFFVAIQTPHSGAGDKAREIFMAGKAQDICTKLDVDRPKLSSFRGPVARSASTVV